ncbi:MAG: beta-propeller fold lactonase family protein [Planctomycetes bacterium]|nr:beta-propeller fold lactonase family protein [Planctomycetota bacterium]
MHDLRPLSAIHGPVPRTVLLVLVLVHALACAARAQSSFVPFESPQTHPAAVSPDGSRLAVVHSEDQRVALYSLQDPRAPVLLREIPVGLEPISVRFRNDDELWVVNWLSDSVSIVSLAAGAVVGTLQTPDEPADVAFAGTPERAFVSATTKDALLVFDPATRLQVGTLAIPAKDPRALAVDAARTRVYVLSARSGNGTTVVPTAQAPLPPTPTNPLLPLAPRQALIVRADDPLWAATVNTSLPDEDLFEVDPQTLAITRRVAGLGTTNFDLVVHPTSGELFVAGLEARNLVRFENVVRANAIGSRVVRIDANGTRSFFDLNPTVVPAQIPDPAAAALALSEPTGLALDAARGKLFVAAQGTDRIGVLSLNGAILARIELGVAGASSNARTKKGPRGFAMHPTSPVLYVVQRLAGSLAVIDTQTHAVIGQQPFAHDPLPPSWKAGRGFLYDAKLSGNGTMSCASCHIDADMDGIAWDLGNTAANMDPSPTGQPFPFSQFLQPFHPMKGPMVTQSLRGLRGQQPFHWRGDRRDLEDFNGAFPALMGGSTISSADMADFKAFLMELPFPPNPNQLRDRSFSTFPGAANAAAGSNAFRTFTVAGSTFFPSITCATCHALPSGSNRQVMSLIVGNNQAELQMKIPQLRNLYRRVGFRRGVPSKTGFGFNHNGAIDTLAALLARQPFVSWPANLKDDIEQFLLAFDTGTAPAVGFQRFTDASNATSLAVLGDLNLLEAQAAAGNCELIAKGRLDGEELGYHFEPATGRYRASRSALGTLARNDLLTQVQSTRASYVFTGVPMGTGRRMGIDRDLDGVLDGDEGLVSYGAGTAGCDLVLRANAPARLGFHGFAFVVEEAAPLTPGILFASLARTSLPLLGVELLVDPFSPVFLSFPLQADVRGHAALAFPLLRNPLLDGLRVDVQALFPSSCGPQGFATTAGLEVTLHR